jgi:hypothetical protein
VIAATSPASGDRASNAVTPPVIDCDIHNVVPSTEALFPALPVALAQKIRSENARSFYRFPS